MGSRYHIGANYVIEVGLAEFTIQVCQSYPQSAEVTRPVPWITFCTYFTSFTSPILFSKPTEGMW